MHAPRPRCSVEGELRCDAFYMGLRCNLEGASYAALHSLWRFDAVVRATELTTRVDCRPESGFNAVLRTYATAMDSPWCVMRMRADSTAPVSLEAESRAV